MNSRLLGIALCILLCSPFTFSQKGPSGTGGPIRPGSTTFSTQPQMNQGAQLRIRITWDNSRSVEDEIVHVQLLTAGNTPLLDTYTDHDGQATFTSVVPGSFRVKVDGPNIDTTYSQVFDIEPLESTHMEWISVRPKESAENKVPEGAAPMVAVSDLKAPSKAKKELQKGMEEFSKSDYKKSEIHVRKALEIYPNYARGWNNLGVILIREGDRAGAIDAWQKSIQADSKFPSGYLNLARIEIQNKQMVQAADYLAKAYACDPSNLETLSLRASEELLTGQYDKALTDAQHVHDMGRTHTADVHLIAGEALVHMDKNADALKEYEKYLKEDPVGPAAAKVREAMAQIQAKLQN
jgi:Tfp pilus assembly protein PilF